MSPPPACGPHRVGTLLSSPLCSWPLTRAAEHSQYTANVSGVAEGSTPVPIQALGPAASCASISPLLKRGAVLGQRPARLTKRRLGTEREVGSYAHCGFIYFYLFYGFWKKKFFFKVPVLRNKTFRPLAWGMSKQPSGCSDLMLEITRDPASTKEALPADQSPLLPCYPRGLPLIGALTQQTGIKVRKEKEQVTVWDAGWCVIGAFPGTTKCEQSN